MLRGTLSNIERYFRISPLFAQVVNELRAVDWASREYGQYEIADGKAYVVYGLYPHDGENTVFEAHDRYIDLQCVLQGDEIIGWADRSRLSAKAEYDESGDCQLFTGVGDTLCLTEGDWALFFPEDAHAPGGKYTQEHSVKLIAKIPTAEF